MKNSGQSMVEYILILALVTSVSLSIFNSRAFQEMFGTRGNLFQNLKRTMAFSFHHAYGGTSSERQAYREGGPFSYAPNDFHVSYRGRFFVSKKPYPP